MANHSLKAETGTFAVQGQDAGLKVSTGFHVKLITPERIFFSAEATQVTAPGTLGEFGVLPGHEPFISTLKPGVITIQTSDGQTRKVAIIGGIAEVVPEHCNILADNARDVTDLSQADAQALG